MVDKLTFRKEELREQLGKSGLTIDPDHARLVDQYLTSLDGKYMTGEQVLIVWHTLVSELRAEDQEKVSGARRKGTLRENLFEALFPAEILGQVRTIQDDLKGQSQRFSKDTKLPWGNSQRDRRK